MEVQKVDAKSPQAPVSDEFYFIVSGKCTECTGFHEEPQCAAVCPVDCCVPDPDHVETKEVLMAKRHTCTTSRCSPEDYPHF